MRILSLVIKSQKNLIETLYFLKPYILDFIFPLKYMKCKRKNGAGERTRTSDLLITNQLLYQLSYTSI